MATSTATITIFPYPKGIDNTQRSQIVRGTIAISAGVYPAGGFPLTWSGLSNANGSTIESIPIAASTPSSTGGPAPFDVDVKSASNNASSNGTGPSGFVYVWDSVLGNLHIFTTVVWGASAVSGPLIEIGGNVPLLVQADTIQFTAYFYRNN